MLYDARRALYVVRRQLYVERCTLQGINDTADFTALLKALSLFGIEAATQAHLLQVDPIQSAARLPHLHRDWAHPCHICTRTRLAAAFWEAHCGDPVLGRTLEGTSMLRGIPFRVGCRAVQLTAAILVLGNIKVRPNPKDKDTSEIDPSAQPFLTLAAKLLGLREEVRRIRSMRRTRRRVVRDAVVRRRGARCVQKTALQCCNVARLHTECRVVVPCTGACCNAAIAAQRRCSRRASSSRR
jgi:hypothetical protein